jgi:hypothetical protein
MWVTRSRTHLGEFQAHLVRRAREHVVQVLVVLEHICVEQHTKADARRPRALADQVPR